MSGRSATLWRQAMPLGVEALEAAVDAALAAEAVRGNLITIPMLCDAEASCMQRTAGKASTVFHLQKAQELQGLCLDRFLRSVSPLLGYVG